MDLHKHIYIIYKERPTSQLYSEFDFLFIHKICCFGDELSDIDKAVVDALLLVVIDDDDDDGNAAVVAVVVVADDVNVACSCDIFILSNMMANSFAVGRSEGSADQRTQAFRQEQQMHQLAHRVLCTM